VLGDFVHPLHWQKRSLCVQKSSHVLKDGLGCRVDVRRPVGGGQRLDTADSGVTWGRQVTADHDMVQETKAGLCGHFRVPSRSKG
jgi:hypothetical protein